MDVFVYAINDRFQCLPVRKIIFFLLQFFKSCTRALKFGMLKCCALCVIYNNAHIYSLWCFVTTQLKLSNHLASDRLTLSVLFFMVFFYIFASTLRSFVLSFFITDCGLQVNDLAIYFN